MIRQNERGPRPASCEALEGRTLMAATIALQGIDTSPNVREIDTSPTVAGIDTSPTVADTSPVGLSPCGRGQG